MTSNKYPKTLEEAFEMMDALLTDEDKRDALKTQDDERYASDQHFGLGYGCVITGFTKAKLSVRF